MSSQVVNKLGAGIVFGVALAASGVYVPTVIADQMKLEDFHMLSVFLAASASSAAIIAVLDHLSIAKRQPRPNSTNNWFSAYDGNMVGGAMVGIGMATTGACPGTVLVQIATGITTGYYTALGGLLGGIIYARFGRMLQLRPESCPPAPSSPHTVDSKLNLKPATVVLVYEILCLAVITACATLGGLDPKSPYLHPVVGGGLIGLAQASSLILTGSPVGVSSAYAEAGEWFWQAISSNKAGKPRPKVSSLTFAAGLLAGSFAFMQYFPANVDALPISPVKAILGGAVMILGARIAGGCTSGHGISGMSAMSVSSIFSVAAMFGGGIATAAVVG